MGQPRFPSPAPPPPGLPLRYTDHQVRGFPWWRTHVVRVVDPDPNPMPFGMPHLFVRRRRGR